MTYVLLFSSGLFLGLATHVYVKKPTPAKQEVQYIHEDFIRIHDEFVHDSQMHGFGDMIECKGPPSISHAYLGSRLLGLTFPEQKIILIDTVGMTPEIFELVVYHELGHYYFNLHHSDDYYSIMYPSVNQLQARMFITNKETSKDNFFREAFMWLFINPEYHPCN